ncbi:MAG: hypothetical protein WA029_17995, partial [Anaerolineae bacterium]
RKPITIIFLRIIDVTAVLLVLWFYRELGLLLIAFLLTLAAVQWPRLSRDSVTWVRTVWGLMRDFLRGRNSVS